jgi:hypothetical protein
MDNDGAGPRKSVRAAAGVSLLAAMAIGLGACGAGGATQARTTAAAVTPTTTAQAAAESKPAAAAAPPAPTQSAAAKANPASAPSKATAPAPTAPKPTTAPAPVVTPAAPKAPALPARRQPTAAEVSSVIASVHALIPFFTPSPAQIAMVGNDVCTAFDQGKTLAQVKATAMQMAGSYAALVPAGVADTAVRTVVALYCPGYASKLV